MLVIVIAHLRLEIERALDLFDPAVFPNGILGRKSGRYTNTEEVFFVVECDTVLVALVP